MGEYTTRREVRRRRKLQALRARMQKMGQGAMAGLLALVLGFIGLFGVAIPAHATAQFDWNWKYTVNCDGITIPFPNDLPSGQSGVMEVNFRFKADGNETTINYKLEGDAYKAKYPNGHAGQTVTIKWDDPLWRNGSIPKSGTWTGLWAQVHGTNYHWEGSFECGTPPQPEPEVVTGSLTFQTLSCVEGSKNWATGAGVAGGVFSFKDENGKVVDLPIGQGYDGGVPEGLAFGNIIVTLKDGDARDNYLVTPWEETWLTVDPSKLDCEPEPQPEVVTGSVTYEVLSCLAGSKNWLNAVAVSDGVYTLTDKNGQTFETTVGGGYTGGVPVGLAYGPITVTLKDAGGDPLKVVTPLTETWTPVHPDDLDCVTEDAIARVSVLTAATCDAPSTIEAIVYKAEWLTEFQTEPGEYEAKAKAIAPSTFIGGGTTITVPYVIDAPLGYQSDDPKAPCYKKPDKPTPTPTPTDTPSPTPTPSDTPQPTPSKSSTPPPAATDTPDKLAATGTETTMIVGGIALAAMLLIGGAVLMAIRRRRQAQL